MCSRTRRACRTRCSRRVSSSSASAASRYASSGAFESTTRFLPPGSFTTRSGRRSRPSSSRLARLLDEVAVREHPRQLDHALELHLAPAAADVRRAERRDETAGLLAEALLSLRHGSSVSSIVVDGREPLLLERLCLLLEPLERLCDRLELAGGELEAATTSCVASASWVSALSCSSHCSCVRSTSASFSCEAASFSCDVARSVFCRAISASF